MEAIVLVWAAAWSAATRMTNGIWMFLVVPALAFGITALSLLFRTLLGVTSLEYVPEHGKILVAWGIVSGTAAAGLARLRIWRARRREMAASADSRSGPPVVTSRTVLKAHRPTRYPNR